MLKQHLTGRFSLATAYRWLKSFDLCQTTLRTHLYSLTPPERGNNTAGPVRRTWRHLEKAFPSSPCPIAAFQQSRQVDFKRPGATRFPNYGRLLFRHLKRERPATQNEKKEPPPPSPLLEWRLKTPHHLFPPTVKRSHFTIYQILAKQMRALLGSNLLRDSQNRDDERRHNRTGAGLQSCEPAYHQGKPPFGGLCYASKNPGVWGSAPSSFHPFLS